VLLPLLSTRELGGTAGTFTLLMLVYSVGSLVGSLRLARRAMVGTRDLGVSAVLLGVGWAALALSPNLLAASLSLVLAGYAGIGVLSGGNAVLQIAASPEMRGRILALFAVVFLGTTPIGGPVAGWVAETYGTPAAIALGAVAAIGAGVAVLAFLRRRAGVPGTDVVTGEGVVRAAEAA
jgi:MFS family permease